VCAKSENNSKNAGATTNFAKKLTSLLRMSGQQVCHFLESRTVALPNNTMVFAIAASTLIGATAAAGSGAPRTTASTRVRSRVPTAASMTTNNVKKTVRVCNAASTATTKTVVRSPATGGAARARGLSLCAAAAEGEGEAEAVAAADESNPSAAAAAASEGEGEVDGNALWKYFTATAGQTALMIWFTITIDRGLEMSAAALVYKKLVVVGGQAVQARDASRTQLCETHSLKAAWFNSFNQPFPPPPLLLCTYVK
jgi:hypothetical protein